MQERLMVLNGRDKQSHMFNNPPNSEYVGSMEWICDDSPIISMLLNSVEPQIKI